MREIPCQNQNKNKRLRKKEKMEAEDCSRDKEITDLKNLSTPSNTNQNQVDLMENEKSVENEERVDNELQYKDVLPQTSLDSYQNCLELLQPLKGYINYIGNKQALLRLREVEKVVKYVIKNEKRPRKSCQ